MSSSHITQGMQDSLTVQGNMFYSEAIAKRMLEAAERTRVKDNGCCTEVFQKT